MVLKLDGIESGATVDQTDAQIKTAYENNSNTNAFTDALQTKLNSVASSSTANPNAIDNVVEDTTPQLGGNLDLNSNNITGTGGIPSANLTGNIDVARLPSTVLNSNVDLTTLSATNMTSGTLPDARFPATLPSTSGTNLTALNATQITSGTVATARLGSGTASSSTFLRGDNTFATVSSYADSDALSLFNASGSAPVYACRAWINFNGTGTIAIRDSGNVSSITDGGAGTYTVTFTDAMADANYCTQATTRNDGALGTSATIDRYTAPTTTNVTVACEYRASPYKLDAIIVCVTVFQ